MRKQSLHHEVQFVALQIQTAETILRHAQAHPKVAGTDSSKSFDEFRRMHQSITERL